MFGRSIGMEMNCDWSEVGPMSAQVQELQSFDSLIEGIKKCMIWISIVTCNQTMPLTIKQTRGRPSGPELIASPPSAPQ